jgi:hypothetical protein
VTVLTVVGSIVLHGVVTPLVLRRIPPQPAGADSGTAAARMGDGRPVGEVD